jgi:hypothetical protein
MICPRNSEHTKVISTTNLYGRSDSTNRSLPQDGSWRREVLVTIVANFPNPIFIIEIKLYEHQAKELHYLTPSMLDNIMV